jgi:ribonuclease R
MTLATEVNPRVVNKKIKQLEGELWVHAAGHAWVRSPEGVEVYLYPSQVEGLLHHDTVRVILDREPARKGRQTGTVQAVLSRYAHTLVGILDHLDRGAAYPPYSHYFVHVLGKHHPQALTLQAPTDQTQAKAWLQAKGQVVVVRVDEKAKLGSLPIVHLTEILGDPQQSGIEIEIAVRQHGLPFVFSAKAVELAHALPKQVQKWEHQGREDLRHLPFVTIDGEDARDLDDAVYVQSEKNTKSQADGWRLWVAVADVSHYVTPGTELDSAAYERATSVYFPRRVIPMLPEPLSNGLCSLNPGVERLSLVCEMQINAKGQLQNYRFYSAVICSQSRLTYTQVNAFIEKEKPQTHHVPAWLHVPLKEFYQLFQALHLARQARGALEFESTQTHIVCRSDGQIERIEPYVRGDAHRMIEEAMLCANVCAADFLAAHTHPGLFRVHEAPTLAKTQVLWDYLQVLGLSPPWQREVVPSGKQLQTLAEKTRTRSDVSVIHTLLLRTMQQAVYVTKKSIPALSSLKSLESLKSSDSSDLRHFGLAVSHYTHFTSPIRRYPDLVVHRLIKALSLGLDLIPPMEAVQWVKKGAKEGLKEGQGKGSKSKVLSKMEVDQLAWQEVGAHCSRYERRADEASRDVQTWLKCQYVKQHEGSVFEGTVTSVTEFGLFVLLDGIYVEGLLHVTQLGADRWHYDAKAYCWRGERTDRVWGLGQKLGVQVARVDIDARKIDLVLAISPSSPSQVPTSKRRIYKECQ